ncbi:hypothetical protein ACROYT_G009489 [Oculina patagonica]
MFYSRSSNVVPLPFQTAAKSTFTSQACLVPRPLFFSRSTRFGSRGPSVRPGYVTETRSDVSNTVKAWGKAVQELGKSKPASQENRENLTMHDTYSPITYDLLNLVWHLLV